jgi:hypothetical protein
MLEVIGHRIMVRSSRVESEEHKFLITPFFKRYLFHDIHLMRSLRGEGEVKEVGQ